MDDGYSSVDGVTGRGQAVAPTMDDGFPSVDGVTGRGQAIAPTMDDGLSSPCRQCNNPALI